MSKFDWNRAAAYAVTCVFVCMLFAVPATAQDKTTYTLDEAVKKALRDSPSIEAARSGTKASEEGRKAARGAFGPSLSTSYSYTKLHEKPHSRGVAASDDDYYTWKLTLEQPIFTGYKILSSYQKAELAKESSEFSVLQAKLGLTLGVQENFINLLIARQNLKSAQDSVERLRSQLKVTQAFYDVGLKPRLDVLTAQVNLSEAETQLLQAENVVETQHARLNTLLNLPLEAEVEYTGELAYLPFSQDLEGSLEEASRNRPDLLIARKAIEIAQKDLSISESEYYPQVAGQLQYYKEGDHFDVDGSEFMGTQYAGWTAGATATWEIFSFGTTYYSVQQNKQIISQLKSSEANTWQEATFEIKSRHLSIAEAAKRIKVAQKTLEQAREAYRMAQARYQAQVGTNTDVLDAQADLTAAEASLTSAMGDYMIAIARLYNAVGRETSSLVAD